MNSPNSVLPTGPLTLKPKWIAAGVLLLVVYLLLRPWLVERFGLDLPGFTDVKPKAGSNSPEHTSPQHKRRDRNRPVEVPVIPEQGAPVIDDEGVDPKVATSDAQKEMPPRATNGDVSSGPAKKPVPPAVETHTPKPKPNGNTPAAVNPPTSAAKSEWGGLKPIGRGKFESTAGLVYDQYRIDHVMEHSRDNTEKPSHGVFEVRTQNEVLALVDEAYELAQKRGPPQVIIEDEGDRTTYTVNMNRQIGRAGGQSGARRRNPPLKMVKIVLEGTKVITAYPTN